jgi:hypothetical protein
MEDQLEKLCAQLQEQNQDNPDESQKDTRHNALLSIQSSINILKENRIKKRRCRTGVISFFCSICFLHLFILFYFGLTPHLTAYVCTSLVTQKYTQFDFISTPSLLKGTACIKLIYITLERNKGLMDGIFQLQNGTISIQDVPMMMYHNIQNASYEWIQGKRDLSTTLLYKDVMIIKEYIEWIGYCIWYPFTNTASDTTRTVVLWLNNKTQIISTLREIIMELPGIKHVRAAVKKVKHTVNQHIIEPIHHKITQSIHGVTNRLFHFSKSFIQWAKPLNTPKDSIDLDTEVLTLSK